MGKSQRTKGSSFERWVANQLKSVFPEAKRHLEFQTQEARGVDLDNTGPFAIQCKAYAKYPPITKIQEVQLREGEIPVLVCKGDRLTPMAVLPFDEFVRLLERAGYGKNQNK